MINRSVAARTLYILCKGLRATSVCIYTDSVHNNISIIMELTADQFFSIMQRMPDFKPSYETNASDQIDSEYNVGIAIPYGKKIYMWFTFHLDQDVCYLIDINRNKKMSAATQICKHSHVELSYGTILYGTYVEPAETDTNRGSPYIVIDDIHYYKGHSMKQTVFANKLKCIYDVLSIIQSSSSYTGSKLCLPALWDRTLHPVPDQMITEVGYQCHHVQYRTMNCIRPHLNVINTRRTNVREESSGNNKLMIPKTIHVSNYTPDLSKPQYKFSTVFEVRPDVQFDVYHLFAFGKSNAPVYYNIAYVPDYKTSVFLNGLFRNIRENRNLDYIEESDDEDDFQNVDTAKYVDLNKVVLMECSFHRKFKRWVPIRVADRHSKIVHISRLVRTDA
jgi:hypothetical protein